MGRDRRRRAPIRGHGDFNPRAPYGARPQRLNDYTSAATFQSTRPVWGATILALPRLVDCTISIHAPRMGRDPFLHVVDHVKQGFQSTRPVWGATCVICTIPATMPISIHAPRMGRDRNVRYVSSGGSLFQSTRPVWGATFLRKGRGFAATLFQSTRPVWGATHASSCQAGWAAFQSTRPVWGATAFRRAPGTARGEFQSTRPVWGATPARRVVLQLQQISIHAPRMGRDSKTAQFSCTVLRKSNSKYNAAGNLQAKYACGIVQTTRAYPYFRCEAPGKSLSACASHSDHQHALRLIAGP